MTTRPDRCPDCGAEMNASSGGGLVCPNGCGVFMRTYGIGPDGDVTETKLIGWRTVNSSVSPMTDEDALLEEELVENDKRVAGLETQHLKRAVALFWLSLSAFACTGTMYVTKLLGADWRLYTALGLGAGLGMLIIGGVCCTAGGRDDEAGR